MSLCAMMDSLSNAVCAGKLSMMCCILLVLWCWFDVLLHNFYCIAQTQSDELSMGRSILP